MKKEDKLKLLSNYLIKNNIIINNDDEEMEKLKDQEYVKYIFDNFEEYIGNMILKLFKKNILKDEEIDNNNILDNIDENIKFDNQNAIKEFKNKVKKIK